MAVTQLQVLEAVETLLKQGLSGVEFLRNDDSLPDPDAAGRVTMFDSEPGPAIEELCGGLKTYRHDIALDILPPQASAPEAAAHAIWRQVAELVRADRSLGGRVDYLDITEMAGGVVRVRDNRTLVFGTANIVAEYTL